ncbi:MAG: hypothetical protein VX610_02115 [SAR324 cluster bacterium]|nr:hypothetical protein [SAR324 cluster bacterium]
MFRIKQAVLWLPALLLLHGAVSEVYAKKCSEQTVKAAFDSGMSADMVASICPKYKETLAASGEEITAQPAKTTTPKSAPATQTKAASSRPVKQSCSEQDKVNMVLAGVTVETIWATCGKPAQTAQAAAAVQPAATVAKEPEPKPKKTRTRRSQQKKAEPAQQEEKSEVAESESEETPLETQHTLGFGLGLGAQTQFLLPYYSYSLDEQLMVGAQLRMMKMDGSSVTAITGSGGYLWKWSDFRLGGQGYLGFGGGVSWGFEGLAFYDLVPGLDLGLALNLPLGSTKSVSHTLGFTMLAGYKF